MSGIFNPGGGGSSQWTDTGTALHPADASGAEDILVGGTSATAPIVLKGDTTPGQAKFQPTASITNPPYDMVFDAGFTNLITNPSFETNTTNWAAEGASATITRVNTQRFAGDWSLKVDVTAATSQGCNYVATAADASSTYVFGGWILGTTGAEAIQIQLVGSVSGANLANITPSASIWQRFAVSKTTTGAENLTPKVVTNGSQTVTIYIDACQLQKISPGVAYRDTYPTTYGDGSMGPGFEWTGTAHASTTTVRSGLKILAPPDGTTYSSFALRDGQIYVPHLHFVSDLAVQDLYNPGTRANTYVRAPFVFEGNLVNTNITLGNSGSVLAAINSGNGAALYLRSSTTTDGVAFIDGQSITSGTILGIYAASNLTTMQASNGKFLDFADKTGASTLKCTVNALAHGSANLNWRHYYLGEGAGRYARTSASVTGGGGANTVGTRVTNRTGTLSTVGLSATVTCSAAVIGTSTEAMVGDTILVNGLTRTIVSATSTTVFTVDTAINLNGGGFTWKNTNIVEGTGTAFSTDFADGDIIVISTEEQVVKARPSATILRTVTPFSAFAAGQSYTKKSSQYEPYAIALENPNGDHETLDYTGPTSTLFISGEDRPKLLRPSSTAGTGTIQTNFTGGSECAVSNSSTGFSAVNIGDIIVAGNQRRVIARVIANNLLITRTPFSPALAAGTSWSYVNVTTTTANPELATSRYEPSVAFPTADTDGEYFTIEADRNLSQTIVASSNAETSIYSFTIPGGRLGTKGGIRCKIAGQVLKNAAGNLTLLVKLGSTTVITTGAMTGVTSVGTRYAFQWDITLLNNASASAQKCISAFRMNEQDVTPTNFSVNWYGSASENSANDLLFDARIQWSASSASLSFEKEIAIVEYI